MSRERFILLKAKKEEILKSILRRKPEADRLLIQIKTLEDCLEHLKKETREMFDEYEAVAQEMDYITTLELIEKGL